MNHCTLCAQDAINRHRRYGTRLNVLLLINAGQASAVIVCKLAYINMRALTGG